MRKLTVILQNLKYITYFTELLPFIFYLFLFKRIITKDKKVFFLYLLLISSIVIFGFIHRYVFNSLENYYLITRVHNFIEYILLAYFFSLQLKNRFIRKSLLISLIPFLLVCIYDFVISKEPSLPFLPLIFEYMVLLFFIIYFFFEVMQETVIEPIYQRSIFWISVAFIVNFSGNFFLFLYSRNSFNNEEFKVQYTIIYSTVTFAKNFLLCISALIKDKKKNQNIELIDMDLNDLHPIQNKNL